MSAAAGDPPVVGPITEPMIRTVIRGMFDTYSRVAHQIDTMDQFMLVMVPSIVRENNVTVIKSKKTKRCHVIKFGAVTMYKPTIKTPQGTVVPIKPHECRKRRLTYASDVYVDVTHEIYDTSNGEHADENDLRVGGEVVNAGHVHYGRLMSSRVYREVLLCELPVMLHSSLCYLPEDRDPVQNDEDLYDQGGYFIVNGSEKVLLPQVTLRNNFPYVCYEKRNPRYVLTCEIRSSHEYKVRSTSTLYIRMTRVKPDKTPQILVNVPFIRCPVTLASVFRLIGVESVRDMYQFIMNENQYPELEYLVNAVLDDPDLDLSLADLSEKIGKKGTQEPTVDKRLRYVTHIFHGEFLPHMGLSRTPEVRRAKALYLGHAVLKLLLVYTGIMKADDRDHISNRRILTPGMLCGLQFRQQWRTFLKALNIVVHRAVESGKFFNVHEIISHKRITSGFKYALSTGNWGQNKGGGTMKNVAQLLTRMTSLAGFAHLRRLNTPLNREGKAPEPRQLHTSTMMLVCPVETPEGAPCGLITNLAMGAHIRIGAPTEPIVALMRSLVQVKPLLECTAHELRHSCKVMVNGVWVGTTDDPAGLHAKLRLARRYQDIPFDTSLAWIQDRNQIVVNTDPGAFLHPVFCLEHLGKLPGLYEQYGHYPATFWNALMVEGVIEFMDKEEEYTYRVAMRVTDQTLPTDVMPYTHAQIHPTLMFGVCAAIIPFPDHNQAPRNMYQSAMGKQAIGVPATNYFNRTDTKMQLLYYPQKPLVTTHLASLLQHDEMPAGQNVRVMIGCFTGYNQEDSVIMNQASVDRGLFRSTVFTLFRDSEKHGGTTDRDVFEKPDPKRPTESMQHGNYEKLNPLDGIIDVGQSVEDTDALIGKVMVSGDAHKKKKHQDLVYRDRSTLWHSFEHGVVDQVMLTSGVAKEDIRMVQVRTRVERVPGLGDKFSSRHGQKGVIGALLRAEDMPFLSDGTQPDLIINPHCLPSRMTIAHLMEMLLGNLCALEGRRGDGTPFRYTSIEQIAFALHRLGRDRYGNEAVYNGTTGALMANCMFVGTCFYQKLRHQTWDKVHARARGPRQAVTRQPNEGRSRDGGLRFVSDWVVNAKLTWCTGRNGARHGHFAWCCGLVGRPHVLAVRRVQHGGMHQVRPLGRRWTGQKPAAVQRSCQPCQRILLSELSVGRTRAARHDALCLQVVHPGDGWLPHQHALATQRSRNLINPERGTVTFGLQCGATHSLGLRIHCGQHEHDTA